MPHNTAHSVFFFFPRNNIVRINVRILSHIYLYNIGVWLCRNLIYNRKGGFDSQGVTKRVLLSTVKMKIKTISKQQDISGIQWLLGSQATDTPNDLSNHPRSAPVFRLIVSCLQTLHLWTLWHVTPSLFGDFHIYDFLNKYKRDTATLELPRNL